MTEPPRLSTRWEQWICLWEMEDVACWRVGGALACMPKVHTAQSLLSLVSTATAMQFGSPAMEQSTRMCAKRRNILYARGLVSDARSSHTMVSHDRASSHASHLHHLVRDHVSRQHALRSLHGKTIAYSYTDYRTLQYRRQFVFSKTRDDKVTKINERGDRAEPRATRDARVASAETREPSHPPTSSPPSCGPNSKQPKREPKCKETMRETKKQYRTVPLPK